MRVKRAEPISRYEAPQYLVRKIEDDVTPEEWGNILSEAYDDEIEIIERNVLGWGYNVIIRYTTAEDEQQDYLAQIPTGYDDQIEYDEAKARVDATPALEPYRDVILYDWQEGAEHWEWVANAPISEIVSWAEDVRKNAEEIV